MATLLQVRDAVALHGIIGVQQLSHQLSMPRALLQAMLEQLESMRKVERVEEDDPCASGGCNNCAESKKCRSSLYRYCG